MYSLEEQRKVIRSVSANLCELSLNDCDNRKSNPRDHGGKPPAATAACRSSFGSLMVLAITARAFLVVAWVATKALFVFVQESPIP